MKVSTLLVLFVALANAGISCASSKSAKSAKSSKSEGNNYTIIHHIKSAKSSAKSLKSSKSGNSNKKSPKKPTRSPKKPTKSPQKKTKSPSRCPYKKPEIQTYLCPHLVTCPYASSFTEIKDKPYTNEIVIGGSLQEGLQIHPGDAVPALGDTTYYLQAGADGKLYISWGSDDCDKDALKNPRIVLFQTKLFADASTAVYSSYTFNSYILSFESFVLANATAYTTLDFQIEFFQNGDLHICYGPLVIGADAYFVTGLGLEFPVLGYSAEAVIAVVPASGIDGTFGGGVGGYISIIPDGACQCLSFQCPASDK